VQFRKKAEGKTAASKIKKESAMQKQVKQKKSGKRSDAHHILLGFFFFASTFQIKR
jgi:hypothetical protein